jgi:hypothetical protein
MKPRHQITSEGHGTIEDSRRSATARGNVKDFRGVRDRVSDVSRAALIACEKETWRLIQQKDLEGFAAYLAEDFYDIFPDGQERNKAEFLEFLRDAELKEYHLSNFRVTMLNQDAAIVTYDEKARAVIQGKEISMRGSVTDGWARRGGKWLNVFAIASNGSRPGR